MSDDFVKALTRLETKMEAVEQTLSELKTELKQSKPPVLPVAGGLIGILAAACTAYLQTTGQA